MKIKYDVPHKYFRVFTYHLRKTTSVIILLPLLLMPSLYNPSSPGIALETHAKIILE